MNNKLFLFYMTPHVDLAGVKQLREHFQRSIQLKYKHVFDRELNSKLVLPCEFSKLYPDFNVVYVLPNFYDRVAKFYIENLSNTKYPKDTSKFVYDLDHQDLPLLSSYVPVECDYIRISCLKQDLEKFSKKYNLDLERFEYERSVEYSKIFNTELKAHIKRLYQDDFDNFC
jgi:hypothetical protein